MGLHETMKLLYNKRNGHQIYESGRKSASYTSDKGLITRKNRELKN
jgi:hypothetical protein